MRSLSLLLRESYFRHHAEKFIRAEHLTFHHKSQITGRTLPRKILAHLSMRNADEIDGLCEQIKQVKKLFRILV
jgi:hypothetical protein